mmetsp:Transcript_18046/g.27775  ORF Transcript_18046/g.27775 Transcript_18046/m.27775 type:complete len:710 (+) Transcript_18046:8032-10161(+)
MEVNFSTVGFGPTGDRAVTEEPITGGGHARGVLERTVLDQVGAGPAWVIAQDQVLASAAIDGIVVRTAIKVVIAAFTKDGVVAVLTKDRVVTIRTVVHHAGVRVEIDVRYPDAGVVRTILVMLDLDPRHGAGNVDQHGIAACVFACIATIAVGSIRSGHGIGIDQRQVAACGQVDLNRIVVRIKGGDAHNAVAIDVVDPEGHVFHRIRKGDVVVVGRACTAQRVAEQAAVVVNRVAVGVDAVHELLIGREFSDRVRARCRLAEGDVHIAGVLREPSQRVAIARTSKIPLKALAHGRTRTAVKIAVAKDQIVAIAAFDTVVTAAGIDVIVAFTGQDRVVARTCVHNVIIGCFARQDRVARIDAVAFGVTLVIGVDQVGIAGAVHDAIGVDWRIVDDVDVIDRNIGNRPIKEVVVVAVIFFPRAKAERFVVIVTNVHGQAGGGVIHVVLGAIGQVFDAECAAFGLGPCVGDFDIIAGRKEMLRRAQDNVLAIRTVHHLHFALLGHANFKEAFAAPVIILAPVHNRVGRRADMLILVELDADGAFGEIKRRIVARNLCITGDIEYIAVAVKMCPIPGKACIAARVTVLRDAIGQAGVARLVATKEIPQTNEVLREGVIEIISHRYRLHLPASGTLCRTSAGNQKTHPVRFVARSGNHTKRTKMEDSPADKRGHADHNDRRIIASLELQQQTQRTHVPPHSKCAFRAVAPVTY